MLLNFIADDTPLYNPYALLINHIPKFSYMTWSLSFKHTLREGNEFVDWLARFGTAMDQSLMI